LSIVFYLVQLFDIDLQIAAMQGWGMTNIHGWIDSEKLDVQLFPREVNTK
jgi:hypothetical protein